MRKRPTASSIAEVAAIPGVGDALRWLVSLGRPKPPSLLLRPSRLSLLVRLDEGRWKVNSAAFEAAIRRSISRLSNSPDELARLQCGFGEMAARSHFDPLDLVEAKIRRMRLSDSALTEMIDVAVALAWNDKLQPITRQISLAQSFARTVPDWELLQIARSWVNHEPDMSMGEHYGLVAVLRIVLRLNPSVLRQWHQRNSGKPVTSLMMSMIGAELWHDRGSLADQLLATRIPFCTAIAIALLGAAADRGAAPIGYRGVVGKLTGRGFAEADAVWLSAHVLKDAVHRHHFLNGRGKGLAHEARRDQKARGCQDGAGTPNWIAVQRADLATRASDHERHLETVLDDVAAAWPAEGLDAAQMNTFDVAFVDTPIMRLRLAEKIAHAGNRQDLLKRNIDRFKSEVGISDTSNPVFDQFHAPDPERFYDLASATALSFIALHREAPEDIGHKAGKFLAKCVTAGFDVLEQPFMRARQPMRWQSALSRTTCAVIFALVIVLNVERAHRTAVERLRIEALKHAANLLVLGRPISGERSVLDTLAGLSIHAMMERPAERDELVAWSQRADLAPLLRARALFALADWEPSDAERARELFHDAARLPLSARAEPEHLNRLAALVDFAIARAASVRDASRCSSIIELWSTLKPVWGHYMSDCEDFAGLLVRGLSTDGHERQRILDDDMFSGSYVHAAIAGAAANDGKEASNHVGGG